MSFVSELRSTTYNALKNRLVAAASTGVYSTTIEKLSKEHAEQLEREGLFVHPRSGREDYANFREFVVSWVNHDGDS